MYCIAMRFAMSPSFLLSRLSLAVLLTKDVLSDKEGQVFETGDG